MSEIPGRRAPLGKRDRFLAELRESAKARGLAFKVEKGKGKRRTRSRMGRPEMDDHPEPRHRSEDSAQIRRALSL
jgi:hypothetical protein